MLRPRSTFMVCDKHVERVGMKDKTDVETFKTAKKTCLASLCIERVLVEGEARASGCSAA